MEKYTPEQRAAFAAIAVKIRAAGGSRADALKAARKLGFQSDVGYLFSLVRRADKRPSTSIPRDMQERLKAQFDSLVRSGLIRGDIRRKRAQ